MLKRDFFDRPVTEVARELLGVFLCVGETGGVIVETEAYHHSDPASHSFRGPTLRNASMFGGPGRAYVYRSYGIHWCFNTTCQPGSGVLIRALEPTVGVALMEARRGTGVFKLLCSGPGRVCQALGITGAFDGAALDEAAFRMERHSTPAVATGRRIGITKGVDAEWRFCVPGSPSLSKPILPARS